MSGIISLSNGFSWFGPGAVFYAIVREVLARLDAVDDKELITLLSDPSGVVDLVELIDLADEELGWNKATAERFKQVLVQAFREIENGKAWVSHYKDPNVHKAALNAFRILCENGLLE